MSLTDSHRKLLEFNKVKIYELTNENIETRLRNLRTTKNKALSDNYLIGILNTIKKENTNITVRPSKLHFNTVRKKKSILNETTRAILEVIKYAYTLSNETIQVTETTSAFDTYIAILLVTSTNISLHDLFDLNIPEYNSLVTQESLNKTKKIVKYTTLFPAAHKIISLLIQMRNFKYATIPIYSMKPKFGTHIITCSPDVLNKKIKELYNVVNFGVNTEQSLGLYSFTFKHPAIVINYLYGD